MVGLAAPSGFTGPPSVVRSGRHPRAVVSVALEVAAALEVAVALEMAVESEILCEAAGGADRMGGWVTVTVGHRLLTERFAHDGGVCPTPGEVGPGAGQPRCR